MNHASHPEFPQFRSKLGAIKNVRRQVAVHRSRHSLEKTMARFLSAGLLESIVRLADRICAQALSLLGCHGRRMLVVDGTTVKTPDTTKHLGLAAGSASWKKTPPHDRSDPSPHAGELPALGYPDRAPELQRHRRHAESLVRNPSRPRHASQREDVLLDMLLLCALDQLPHRPGRHQPRAVKRRPKP
jgi:hypothetical protein